MTIKNAAQLTGISQANIRYYESEGLLDPQRGSNGYRTYSEADIDLLLRIKLLRMLGLTIDTIQALSAGDTGLKDALARRLAEVDAAAAQLQRSRAVCETLQQDGAAFETLDARRYLALLELGDSSTVQQDVLPRIKSPYRRLFARSFDSLLWTLGWVYVQRYLSQSELLTDSRLYDLLNILVGVLLVLAIEPILLHLWGTTPGKWIMGLYVTDMEDRKLSHQDAFTRTWKALWYGCGFNIPIYSLIRHWISLSRCESGKGLEWEEDTVLHLKDTRIWRTLVMVVASALLFLLSFGIYTGLVGPQKDILPNKGDLTLSQFCENFNAVAGEYHTLYQIRLDENANWLYLDRTTDYYTPVGEGHYMLEYLPELEFQMENGIVKGVHIYWMFSAEEYTREVADIPDYHEAMQFIAQALVCAQMEQGSRSDAWDALEVINSDDGRYLSYILSFGDITVTNVAEYEGYIRKRSWSVFGFTEEEYILVDDYDSPPFSCLLEFTITCP